MPARPDKTTPERSHAALPTTPHTVPRLLMVDSDPQGNSTAGPEVDPADNTEWFLRRYPAARALLAEGDEPAATPLQPAAGTDTP
ncbi:hypothetical protein [Nocardia brasiliensis]|uniref:hypothetical protein n=1 Tax=Nocardia brasiliensis TaxID=37326 RepID=UPI003D904972